MIPSWMLAGHARLAESSMTDTCTIERKSGGVDAAGRPNGDWDTVATSKMRLLPEARRITGDNQIGGREVNRLYARIALPIGTDVRDGDRFVIEGRTWEILRLQDQTTDKAFITADIARKAT